MIVASLPSSPSAVLVCAPIGRTASVVHRFLAHDGHDVATCDSLDQLIERLGDSCLVLLTAELIAHENEFYRLVGALDAQRPHADPSVIVLTRDARAFHRTLLRRTDGRTLPNLKIIERPVSPGTLRALVDETLCERMVRAQERQRIAELEARNVRLDAFSRTLAHDLRAPLQTLSMALDLIERVSANDLGDNHWMLQRARQATRLIDEYTRDLLLLAVADQAELDAPRPVDLDTLVRELADTLSGTPQDSHDRAPRVEVVGQMPTLSGHQVLLRQLFQNLISNGLKYNTAPDPTVWIEATRDDDGWQFRVHDNGIGLPDDIDALFSPFERGHAIERTGTGLGLAICKRAVELHHGEIRAENRPDGGSVFTFELRPPPSPRPTASPPAAADPPARAP